jgi:Fe-S-cluster containining protein
MGLPLAPAFNCTRCGDCCRGFGREEADWEPEGGPLVRLTETPGLPLLSWEWQRARHLAAAKGTTLDVAPFDAVADEANQRLVVLSYRLAAMECPFFAADAEVAAGPRSEAWGFTRGGVCSVYEHRFLACRAYPLVPLKLGVAISLHCPELVDADPGSEAALRAAYGDSFAAAQAFRGAPQLAVDVLRALEAGGHVRVARDAAPLRDAARQDWPRVDLCELAAQHGVAAWEELEHRARRSG